MSAPDVSTLMRRLAIATKRWLREQQRLHLLQFRKNWATMRSEYECVGGPLDGRVIKWDSRFDFRLGQNLGGGTYRHEGDFRLHYHVDAPAGFGT